MSVNLKTTESKFFERVRTALANANNSEEIKNALLDYGVTTEQLADGEKLYSQTKAIWELNRKEDSETKVASKQFTDSYQEFRTIFKRHRDITKIYYRTQPEKLVVLGVKGNFPKVYNELFDKSEQFYTAIKENKELQDELTRIKITPKVINESLKKHTELLSNRSNFDKEMGESQDATKNKDAAIIELKEWVSQFDAIAEIALFEKPQLLEVLGIHVRS